MTKFQKTFTFDVQNFQPISTKWNLKLPWGRFLNHSTVSEQYKSQITSNAKPQHHIRHRNIFSFLKLLAFRTLDQIE